MYNFILSMWVRGKVTEANIAHYVSKGYITQDEANFILATPKAV